jgi:hypothetical protein
VRRATAALVLVLLPTLAEACATCIGSPFGDRTYNWPYLGLILLPFVVMAVVGGVLARASGVSVSTVRRRLARLFHPAERQEETT